MKVYGAAPRLHASLQYRGNFPITSETRAVISNAPGQNRIPPCFHAHLLSRNGFAVKKSAGTELALTSATLLLEPNLGWNSILPYAQAANEGKTRASSVFFERTLESETQIITAGLFHCRHRLIAAASTFSTSFSYAAKIQTNSVDAVRENGCCARIADATTASSIGG